MTSVFIPRLDAEPLVELTALLNETFATEPALTYDQPTQIYDFVLEHIDAISQHEYQHDILSLTANSIVCDESNILVYIRKFANTVSSTSSIPLSLRIELLDFCFTLLEKDSGLRYDIFKSLVPLYNQSPYPYHFWATVDIVEKALPKWGVPLIETVTLFHQIYLLAKKFSSISDARKYLGKALAILSRLEGQHDAAEATACAVTAAVDALTLTTPEATLCHHIGYDVLLEAPAVQHLRTIPAYAPLVALLEIYCNGTVSQLEAFLGDSENVKIITTSFPTISLDTARENVTALVLSDHVKPGQTYTYAEIAGFLQLSDAALAEEALVDSFTVGQVSGKINQDSETVSIHRVSPRRYVPELWETLRQQIEAWFPSLQSMLLISNDA